MASNLWTPITDCSRQSEEPRLKVGASSRKKHPHLNPSAWKLCYNVIPRRKSNGRGILNSETPIHKSFLVASILRLIRDSIGGPGLNEDFDTDVLAGEQGGDEKV